VGAAKIRKPRWSGKRATVVLLREAADMVERGHDRSYGRNSNAAFVCTLAFDDLSSERRFRYLLKKEVHWTDQRIDAAVAKVYGR